MRRFLILAMLILVSPAGHPAKLYKWVDSTGHVSFQDHPPPAAIENFEVEEMKQEAETSPAKDQPTMPVTLFSVENCQSCAEIRSYLERRNIPVTILDPEQDEQVASKMKEQFGRIEVPIVLLGKKELKGVNVPWLATELDSAGFPAVAKDRSASR